MSRLDEALRRMDDDPGAAAQTPRGAGNQHLFRPDWTGVEERPRPVPVPASGRDIASGDTAVGTRLATSVGPSLRISSQWRERMASGAGSDPMLVEQFRRLAASLHHAQQTNGLRCVMVTSAVPGDGKTLTAINLATVLAESYRAHVLLIDADLRRPSISNVMDLGDGAGLSDGLRSATEQKLALVSVTPRLTLLPAGRPVPNSIEALTSPRMQQILDEAVTRFDWVILDAPPIGPTADAHLLAQMVGGAIFVIHAGRTQYADVQNAIKSIGRDAIIGVVLNGVEAKAVDAYYGEVDSAPRS